MASPNADLVWALQWAKRTHLFSFQNLTIWGLGLPLGILAWAGFLWMGWRMVKGEWLKHLLLWSWMGIYFTWQSLQYNPTMRYQLPVYPLLAMMAAWVVFEWAKPHLPVSKRELAGFPGSFCRCRGSGAHFLLGICFQQHLYPYGTTGRSYELDLPERSRADRP